MKKNIFLLAFAMYSCITHAQDLLKAAAATEIGMERPKYVTDNSSNGLSQSELFNEVAPSGYDLVNANISFTDKDQVQKVGISPLKMLNEYYGVLSNMRLNFTNKSGALTAGISFGYDNTAYQSKRVQRLFNSFNISAQAQALPTLPTRGTEETIAEYEARTLKEYKDQLKPAVENFENQRLQHVFKYSFGYNAQFFPVLKSESSSSSYDSLNYHGFKGHNFFINSSYGYKNGCFTVEGAYNYFNKRKAADSLQTLNRYDGFSLGVKKRLFWLIGMTELESKDFYKNSRFIPSVYLGFSYEESEYKGNNYLFAEDNAKRIKAYTPYIDVCISPSVQFRLSVPIISKSEYVAGSKGTEIGTILSFNYKLVNLN